MQVHYHPTLPAGHDDQDEQGCTVPLGTPVPNDTKQLCNLATTWQCCHCCSCDSPHRAALNCQRLCQLPSPCPTILPQRGTGPPVYCTAARLCCKAHNSDNTNNHVTSQSISCSIQHETPHPQLKAACMSSRLRTSCLCRTSLPCKTLS